MLSRLLHRLSLLSYLDNPTRLATGLLPVPAHLIVLETSGLGYPIHGLTDVTNVV